VSDLFKFQ